VDKIRAHRWAYETFVGPIPDGLGVCHHCDTPSCVRPDHLFVGTQKDNVRDCISKGRFATGERSGSYTHPERRPIGERSGAAKLTEADIPVIREMAKTMSRRAIAEHFSMGSHSAINNIVNGITWTHV